MTKTKATIVSARELAAALGLAEKTITNLATEGGVVIRLGRGRFDKWKSVARYLDHLRKAAEQRKPTEATEQRARLASLQADALERRNIEEAAELIIATEADQTWAETSKFVRDGCLSVVPRIAAALPHLGEAGIEIVRREIEDVVQVLNGPPPHRKLTKA